MKREVMSKLIRLPFGWTHKVPSVWMKSSEFLKVTRCGPSILSRYFANLYVGASLVLIMGRRPPEAQSLVSNNGVYHKKVRLTFT
jgi:hypothetical protein